MRILPPEYMHQYDFHAKEHIKSSDPVAMCHPLQYQLMPVYLVEAFDLPWSMFYISCSYSL